MTEKKLNPKQLRFIDEYMIDLNATRAYKEVYGVSDKMANANGSRLIANDSIKKEIERRRKSESEVTDMLRKDLRELFKKWAWNKNGNVTETTSIRAAENLGKHVGFFNADESGKSQVVVSSTAAKLDINIFDGPNK